MRVVIDYRSALRARTGAGEYIHHLARAVAAHKDMHQPTEGRTSSGSARSDVDVTVFSSSWKDRLDVEGLPGIRTVDRRVPVGLLNLLWHRTEWPPIEQLAGGRFDVAHSAHPLLMPARHAAQVITIHDLDFLSHPERTRGEIRRDYPGLVHAHARRARRIVVSSRYTAGEVQRRLDVPADRISLCSPGAPDWRPRATFPEGPSERNAYLLFIGTLEPRKNVGGLLRAYASLLGRRPDLPDLVIAGGATPASGPLLETIDRAPLRGKVRYLGYVASDRVVDTYSGAIAVVLPSFEEGFGLPVLEAMTLGVPVVAANRGSLPEILGDAGLLVDPEDDEALAGALDRMTTDPVLASACAARGLQRARAFTWERAADAAVAAYEAAIAG